MKFACNVPVTLGDDNHITGIKHAAELDIEAVEFWDHNSMDVEAVAAASNQYNVSIAAIVSSGAGANAGIHDKPGMTDPDCHNLAVADIRQSLGIADRLDTPNLIVTVGPDQNEIDDEIQQDAVVEVLRAIAPDAADAGVTVVVEPLNVATDHSGYFLVASDDGFELVDRVASPNVRLLYDIYHQQISEGNIIDTIRAHVDQIGHIHFADVPGRHEPGTGEINYRNVFDAIQDSGYDGYVGAEYLPDSETDESIQEVQALF